MRQESFIEGLKTSGNAQINKGFKKQNVEHSDDEPEQPISKKKDEPTYQRGRKKKNVEVTHIKNESKNNPQNLQESEILKFTEKEKDPQRARIKKKVTVTDVKNQNKNSFNIPKDLQESELLKFTEQNENSSIDDNESDGNLITQTKDGVKHLSPNNIIENSSKKIITERESNTPLLSQEDVMRSRKGSVRITISQSSRVDESEIWKNEMGNFEDKKEAKNLIGKNRVNIQLNESLKKDIANNKDKSVVYDSTLKNNAMFLKNRVAEPDPEKIIRTSAFTQMHRFTDYSYKTGNNEWNLHVLNQAAHRGSAEFYPPMEIRTKITDECLETLIKFGPLKEPESNNEPESSKKPKTSKKTKPDLKRKSSTFQIVPESPNYRQVSDIQNFDIDDKDFHKLHHIGNIFFP